MASSYSKSVLRVAADAVSRIYDWVDYFPAFEIITGSYNDGAYFGGDHREVTESGVAHVMRCFIKNYVGDGGTRAGTTDGIAPGSGETGIPDYDCDEAALDPLRP